MATQQDLEPARMNQPDQLSRYHATGGSTAPTSVSSTSTTSASAVSTTTTSITSVPSPSASAQAEHKTPVAAIAGGAAGGAFALAAIIGLVIYYMCFVKKSRKGHADTLERRQSLSATGMTETAMKSSDGEHSIPKTCQTPLTDTLAAPPSYSSPNPNINTFYNPLSQHPHPQDSDPRYVTYAHHDPNYPNQHPHNWQPPPQELPVINAPPFPGSHKSMYGHRRGPSELSGDHPRSELESGSGTSQGGSWKADKRKTMYQPMASPRSPQGMASSPMMSPMIEKHNDTNIGVGSPVSPPAQRHEFDSQGNPGMTESGAGPAVMTQNWMAPRDWEPPTQGRGERLDVRNGEEGDGGAQGLGMLDVPDGVDGVQERLDIQKAERRQSPRPRAYSGAF
jgi:hypothetical protein